MPAVILNLIQNLLHKKVFGPKLAVILNLFQNLLHRRDAVERRDAEINSA